MTHESGERQARLRAEQLYTPSDSWHVKAVGAVGDGVADDTDAFVRAVKLCEPFGVIELSPGDTYLLRANQIVVDKPIRITGGGHYLTRITTHPDSDPGWMIQFERGDHTYTNHLYGCVVENLFLDGNSRGSDVGGLFFDFTDRFTIQNCRIAHFQRSGIFFNASTREGFLQDLYLRNCGTREWGQVHLTNNSQADGTNLTSFNGIVSSYPHGDNLRIVEPQDAHIARNLYFSNFILHGGDGYPVVDGDGTEPRVDADIDIWSSRNVYIENVRGVYFSNGRIHYSGRGQPNMMIADNADGGSSRSLVFATNVDWGTPGGELEDTFTVDASTDIFTCEGSMLSDGARVRFSTDGTLPSPLASGTDYFVIAVNDDEFQVTDARYGDTLDITDTGSGTHTVTTQNVKVDTGTDNLFSVATSSFSPPVENGRAHILHGGVADDLKVSSTVYFNGLDVE